MSSTIRLVNDDLRPPGPPPRRHLISIADLTRDDVERLLGTARTFESTLDRQVKKLPTLKGHLVVNLFYESSTRTSSTSTTVRPSSGKSSCVARTTGCGASGASPPRTLTSSR